MLTDAAALTGISGMTPRVTEPATLKPPEPPPPPTLWARMPSEAAPFVKILLPVRDIYVASRAAGAAAAAKTQIEIRDDARARTQR
jgi:hypothetical protein